MSADQNLNGSMGSSQDFHARMSATRARWQESMEVELACTGKLLGCIAVYDPIGSCWRTSQVCLTGGLAEFSETWPKSGVMRNGIAIERRTSERLRSGSECLYLPTPQAIDWKGTSYKCCKGRTVGHLKHWTHGTALALHSESGESSWPNPELSEWLVGLPNGWTDLSCG